MNKKTHNIYKQNYINNKQLLIKGTYGIKSLGYMNISQTQLTKLIWLLKKKIKEYTKLKTKIWILSNCYSTSTKLSLESRMGKGKGNIINTFFFCKPGKVLFETTGVSRKQLKLICFSFSKIIPLGFKVVTKYNN